MVTRDNIILFDGQRIPFKDLGKKTCILINITKYKLKICEHKKPRVAFIIIQTKKEEKHTVNSLGFDALL